MPIYLECTFGIEHEALWLKIYLSDRIQHILIGGCKSQDCKTLVQALVTPRLDYGNALLYDIFLALVSRLQRIQ